MTAGEGMASMIGNVLLKRFNVVYDYPHDRIYLEPGKGFDHPFGDY